MRGARRSLAGAAALVVLVATPLAAQRTVGIGAHFMGYTFEDGLGAQAAQLFLMPLAVRVPLGDAASLDLYSAWAEGRVETEGVQYALSGVTDTRVKVSYQARPWALVSVSGSLPTGNSTHSGQEALVASFLSADLLGFREATWGTGGSITSSVATARRVGEWGVGLAGAYSMRGEFQPLEPIPGEEVVTYRPGSEMRLRFGVDRNIGTNTVTGGVTVMNFSKDQANGQNLFQPGLRMRFDVSYLFRMGAGVWSVYLTDVVRQHGDLTLDIVDASETVIGQDTLATPSQNLLVGGFVGTVAIGGNYVFRPQVDLKIQSRTSSDGSDQGSGWILAAGGDFPIRVFGVDAFPRARAFFGGVKDVLGTSRGLLGMEFTATFRAGF